MTSELARARRARVDELRAARGWSALLVYGNAWRCDYLRYLSDFAVLEGHAFALLEPGRLRLFVEHPHEAERAEAETSGNEIVCARDTLAAVTDAVAGIDGVLAAAPLAFVPEGVVARLRSACVDATAVFDELLMRKLEGEIDAVRRAAALADAGYEVFRAAARPGRTEYEVVADVEAWFRSQGCPDNFMILGSGGTEVRGMHPPGERRLKRGDLVTTELTPCVDGYYAQICRTLVVGEPSAAQKAAFAIYVEAMEAGLAAVRPGATAAEIARAENDVFRRHGLGEYTTNRYTRVRGHGLGLYVDTRPALLEDVDTPLEAGMTVIVHPNTYNPEVGYIVLGDAVIVRDGGCELLTRTPRELFSVPA